ncbi:tetratricopeptide repeat protein [Carboxylicivirga sp. N1Y90]|uniref:tetratricopeptide repeat protein n=1 Tax=Carboxylicivirga fragile TaxID=3417571 RepID=UPI003D344D24|nr:tetratricopeptide repeat protein [Marinilabiliaceae bacterium N1Y90]
MRKITTHILLSISLFSFAQNQVLVDSLEIVIENSTSSTAKYKAYEELFKNYYLNDYGKALEVAHRSYELSLAEKNIEMQISSMHRLGNIKLFMGRYEQSIEYYFQALKLLDKSPNRYKEFAFYNNIGINYDRIQRYNLALEYYFKALEIFNSYHQSFDKKINTNELHTQIYNNIGNVYEVKNDNGKAIQYYKKALEISSEDDNPITMSQLLNNLGKIYRKTNDYPLAKQFLERSLNIRLSINDNTGVVKSYYNLAEYYLAINKPDSALLMIETVTPLLTLLQSLELTSTYHAALHQIHLTKKDYQKALMEFTLHKQFADSLLNKQSLMQISNLEAQQKIENIEKGYELEQEKTKFRNTLLFIGLLSIVLIAIFIISIITLQKKRINIKKDALEADLDYRNKEMATNVMYLVRKNELINNVAKRLLNLKENLKEENKTPINSIIYELQTEIDKEVWGEFEMRFQQVHKNFYGNLRDSHPDLTPAEERLCAFLRLNMSSKEIAAINHQNAKSIEVARARLRKKLNLTGTDTNLISYLAEF